ncbi:hypothetical protein EVAR_92860_1 [Eumeta japonica]|uniref:Uncharacterized protein n=1 Tax=Eumeta variegata TaxID=151549 RepID=A0A4C1TA57_EUMVA|nr:hypothetical protein EVAR_92860_1 [Eumeta japonica]
MVVYGISAESCSYTLCDTGRRKCLAIAQKEKKVDDQKTCLSRSPAALIADPAGENDNARKDRVLSPTGTSARRRQNGAIFLQNREPGRLAIGVPEPAHLIDGVCEVSGGAGPGRVMTTAWKFTRAAFRRTLDWRRHGYGIRRHK